MDNIDANSTANLDVSPFSLSSKASVDIKMDMVNPMPARNPIPKNRVNVTFSGKWIILDFTSKKAAVIMPKGLPINKPKMMAKESGDIKLGTEAPDIYRLVFANAKMGIIRKSTGKLRIDWNRVILLIGSSMAIIIPANVA